MIEILFVWEMMICFSGVVTFKKVTDIQEAAQTLPLDKILVETDAPYLAPVLKRGRENKTAYTRYVVDKNCRTSWADCRRSHGEI